MGRIRACGGGTPPPLELSSAPRPPLQSSFRRVPAPQAPPGSPEKRWDNRRNTADGAPATCQS
eukprot:510469-Alexandrium_andersonii.AAC.1